MDRRKYQKKHPVKFVKSVMKALSPAISLFLLLSNNFTLASLNHYIDLP